MPELPWFGMEIDTIFFDVGSTLVFAEPKLVRGPLFERHLEPSEEQLCAAETEARRAIDKVLQKHSAPVDGTYWSAYYRKLLSEMGIDDAGLAAALIARARESSNWCRLKPGTPEVLEQFRKQYRLGVISNSDGRVSNLLEKVGIRRFFDTVTDSGTVGVEKPDSRIFRAATESLNAVPEHSLYLGDIYSVDYVGATEAGMKAILMDSNAVYRRSNLPRVESLRELLDIMSFEGR